MRAWRLMGCSLLLMVTAGCAIHYYDQRTGVEHLWGFGHLRMRVAQPAEGVRAIIKGHQEFGLGLGLGTDEYYCAAGYHNERQVSVLNEDTAVRLSWPDNAFFNVRVGTNVPPPVATSTEPK